MLKKIKANYNEFQLLPEPLKMFITAALFITLGFGIFSGGFGYLQNRKIERLERENYGLRQEVQTALEKVKQAETNAAAEALRARSLEEKIKPLEEKEKQVDEKIITSQKNSNNLTRELHRVRISSPANTSTEQLERRLRDRYSQENSNQ